jgi:fucose permease
VGIGAVILPLHRIRLVTLVGLVLIGLGCAPIYPCIIHETPRNFGPENSQAIIGIQMASAYTGSTLMPPLFGWLANLSTIALFPFFLSLLLVLMVVMTERLNRLIGSRGSR